MDFITMVNIKNLIYLSFIIVVKSIPIFAIIWILTGFYMELVLKIDFGLSQSKFRGGSSQTLYLLKNFEWNKSQKKWLLFNYYFMKIFQTMIFFIPTIILLKLILDIFPP